MAITYVGGNSNTGTGATISVDLAALTGGSNSSPSEGDLVVVVWGHGDTTDSTMSVSTSGYDTPLDLYQTETWDPNLGVASKFMGSTPDSTCVVNRTSNAAYGGAAVVHVWRGVDRGTRYDVTRTTASAQNTSRADPPAITPTTAGAVIVVGGIGTQTTGGDALTLPTGTNRWDTNGITVKSDGTTSDAGVFIGSKTNWSSGEFNPDAITAGGTTSTSSGWIAVTIALRPQLQLAPAKFSNSSTYGAAAARRNLLHYVISTGTEPSASQIKAGQNSSGGAATAYGREVGRTTTGEQVFSAAATGLTASTLYRASFVWSDGTTDSNVVSTEFTTDAVGAVTLSATRYTDPDTFGNALLRARATVAPTLHTNPDTFGNAAIRTVTRLGATRVVDSDSFGNAALRAIARLSATRYTDPDTFGNAALRSTARLIASAYTDPDSFGNASLRAVSRLAATVHVDPDTFGNAVLFQPPTPQTLSPTLAIDGDTFGNASLRARARLAPTLYGNAPSFGNAALRARYTIGPTRVVDGDTFGNASLRARSTLAPTRVADGDSFGNAVLRARATLAATGYVNTPTFGAAILLVGDGKQYLSPTVVSDGDSFGNASLRATITLGASHVVNDSTFGAHVLEGGGEVATPATDKVRGAGGLPRRKYYRIWNGREWVEVHSQEQAQAVIADAEQQAQEAARTAIAAIAAKSKPRARSARRAAPVVRVESAPVDVQAQVEAANARIRAAYESALRTEMIARLLQQRLEDDEEDAILALLD